MESYRIACSKNSFSWLYAFFIALLHVLMADGLSDSSIFSKAVLPDYLSQHYEGMECLPFLLKNSKLNVEDFMSEYFQKKVFFVSQSNSTPDEKKLTKVEPSVPYPSSSSFSLKFVSFLSRSMELRNSWNIYVFKDGETLDNGSGNLSVSQSMLHHALMEGATVILKFAHRVHTATYDWAVCLQNDLGAPTELDVWIYPSLASGMYPQAISDDLFLFQQSGEIDLTVCERQDIDFKDVENTRVGALNFTLQELSNFECDLYILAQNEVMYIPQGYIFYPTTSELNEISVTHAWHVERVVVSYSEFFFTLVSLFPEDFPPEFAEWFREASKFSEELLYKLDTTTIGNSVSNFDFPNGWIDQFKIKVLSILKELINTLDEIVIGKNWDISIEVEPEKNYWSNIVLLKKLVTSISDGDSLFTALNEFRSQLALGMAATYQDHLHEVLSEQFKLDDDSIPSLNDNTVLRLLPYVRASLENSHNLFIVNTEVMPLPSEEDIEAYKYCLGRYGTKYSRGIPFKVSSIPVALSTKRREIARLLLTVGAVAVESNDGSLPPQHPGNDYPASYKENMNETNDFKSKKTQEEL